jgi:hypothetical protein
VIGNAFERRAGLDRPSIFKLMHELRHPIQPFPAGLAVDLKNRLSKTRWDFDRRWSPHPTLSPYPRPCLGQAGERSL